MKIEIAADQKKNWDPGLDSDQAKAAKRVVKRIQQKAAPGAPYSIAHIIHECRKESPESITMAQGVVHTLLFEHDWFSIGDGSFWLPGRADVSLPTMLDAGMVPILPVKLDQLNGMVRYFTREKASESSMRSALSRLVDKGKFKRDDNGKYYRAYRGVGYGDS